MSNLVEKKEFNAPVATTPATLLAIAVEQGADIDKLEKLMNLQERWEASEAKKAYVVAMANFRSECPKIVKTLKGHNCTYAGLAETIDQIKEIMSANGLTHSWTTEQGDKETKVTCCVTHTLGHRECTSLAAAPDTSGSKNAIQAVGSTVKYLQRYTMFSILGLASQEFDDDGAGAVEYITESQAADIRALIEEVGADEAKFLRYLKAKSVDQINIAAFGMAVKALEAKRNK